MDDTSCTKSVEQQLYKELKPSVWTIVERTSEGFVLGTGFSIDSKGLIMTCSHCVKDTFTVANQDDQKLRRAVLLHRIEPWDIAILCLEAELNHPSSKNYPHVSLAEDGTLMPGQDVYSIGHQNRFMYSFSSGKVSYPCSNNINQFGSSSSTSKQARISFSTTPEYRTAKEICEADLVNLDGDLPVIEIMNLHSASGGSGSPVFLPTGEVVGMITRKEESKSLAVHVSALQIAFKLANEEYNKRVSSLSTKSDKQEQLKDRQEVKSDKSK